jgi:hypothetical protein
MAKTLVGLIGEVREELTKAETEAVAFDTKGNQAAGKRFRAIIAGIIPKVKEMKAHSLGKES